MEGRRGRRIYPGDNQKGRQTSTKGRRSCFLPTFRATVGELRGQEKGPGGPEGGATAANGRGETCRPLFFAPGGYRRRHPRVRKTESYKPRGPVFYTTKVVTTVPRVTVVSPQGAIQTRVQPPRQGGDPGAKKGLSSAGGQTTMFPLVPLETS